MKIPGGYRHMEAILKTSRPPGTLVAVNLMVHAGMQKRLIEYNRRRLKGSFLLNGDTGLGHDVVKH